MVLERCHAMRVAFTLEILKFVPMRLAIVSDIHANLEALQTALEIIKNQRIDQIICLGDVVGYGANPNECLTLIQREAAVTLLGNHDQACIDASAMSSFNPFARVAAQWTFNQLREDNKDYLRNLPYTWESEGLFFVHASPYEPEEWHYIITDADARDNFDHFSQKICFVGHSHVAEIFSAPMRPSGPVEVLEDAALEKGRKYIINVGSVGQPRDGDWRSGFGIFDTKDWSYEQIRAEYDVQQASQKILAAGLPRMLAERILTGK